MAKAFGYNVTGDLALSANSYRGRGKLLLGAVLAATGVPANGGFREMGNVSVFSVTPEFETDARRNYTGCAATDEDLPITKNLTVTITTDTITAQTIAAALSGTATDGGYTSNLGDAITDVLITSSATAGLWYQLFDENGDPLYDFASNAVIDVEHDADGAFAAGAVALVEGTDYEFDRKAGMIRMLIVDPAFPFVAFTFSAATDKLLDSVDALTTGFQDYAIRFKGINGLDCETIQVDIFSVQLRSEEALNFIGDERMTVTLTGKAKANTLAKAIYNSTSEFMRIVQMIPAA